MFVLFIIISYLFGSVSSAVLVCKLMGLPDPRLAGSNNPGATNVLRIGGKIPAIFTLLGDVLKGTLPVCFTLYFFPMNHPLIAGVAFAAFIGHLYPIFFGFQGGKGVATFLGCLIAISWLAAIVWGVMWLAIAGIFRYASLASLVASAVIPVILLLLGQPFPFILSFTAMLPFLLIRHKTNIQLLLQGKERKLAKKIKSQI